MMDLETIRELSREAALRAAAAKKQPFLVEKDDIGIDKLRIPDLGDYVPPGWRRVNIAEELDGEDDYYAIRNNAYFVDSSGVGQDWEPALTLPQFCKKLRAGYGYAIIEGSYFQVQVGVFKKESK